MLRNTVGYIAVAAALLFAYGVRASGSTAIAVEPIAFDFATAIARHADSPSRFAEPLLKRIDARTRGVWSSEGDAAVWRYAVEIPGAVSLGFYADEAILPSLATVEIETDATRVVYGARRFRSGTLLTSPLPGSSLKVTLRMPAASKSGAKFSIERFNVGYKSLTAGRPDHPLLARLRGTRTNQAIEADGNPQRPNPYEEAAKNSACDRNFICVRSEKPAVADAGQSVVGLTIFGVAFCTANLVSDAAGSFTPYLVSAAHCIDYGDAVPPNADGYIIRWSQETPCGTDLEFVSNDPSKETTGAVVRAMYQDAFLLEASDQPPYGANPYWAGWSAEEVSNFQNYKPYDPAASPRDYGAENCDPQSPYYKPSTPYCTGIKEQVLYGIHHGRTHTKQYVETGTTENSSAEGSMTFTNQQQMPNYPGPDGSSKKGPIFQAWILKLSPLLKTGRIAGGASGSGVWYADRKQIIGMLSTSDSIIDSCPKEPTSTSGSSANYQRFREAFFGPPNATSATALKFWLDPSNTGVSQRTGVFDASRAGPSTVTLGAAKAAVFTGESVTLDWSTSKAGFCHLSGDELADHGIDPSGTETFAVRNVGMHSFTLRCQNDAGVLTASSTSVNVLPPSVSLTTSRSSISLGDSIELTWTSAKVDMCQALDRWTGPKPVTGSETLTPTEAGSYQYRLLCDTNPRTGDVQSNIVIVQVVGPPAPVVTLTSSTTSAVVGSLATLTWSSTNSTSCNASGDWSGARNTGSSATVTVSRIGSNAYNLTCTGAGGSTSKAVTVTGTPVENPGSTPVPSNPGMSGGSSGDGGGGSFDLSSIAVCMMLAMARRQHFRIGRSVGAGVLTRRLTHEEARP